MKTTFTRVACAFVLSFVSSLTNAALIDRGGGLIYDTDLNITWLADANYAMTSGYDADGAMTWAVANTWAANLSYYDSVRNVIYDDWRLPTTLQPDGDCWYLSSDGSWYGYGCQGSEMGHLFYNELGGVMDFHIITNHDADYNLFTNVEWYGYYWSATEYAPNTSNAWFFATSFGYQDDSDKTNVYLAWAVRPGDVAAVASTVPVPAAAWLFGSGLLGLIGMARRKVA